MIQTYAPCLFRQQRQARAEEVYALSDTSCDPLGYMSARKDLTLGGIWLDLGRFDASEQILLSCMNTLSSKVGRGFFIWTVCHQLLALCYISQGRFEEAEAAVSSLLKEMVERTEQGSQTFGFPDYELAEVYLSSFEKAGKI